MGFSEEISTLKSKAEGQLHALSSREKTKNGLFLPFIQALGYDPFDVREVEPGFAVDVGGEGHKTVDYAVKKGGTPVMFFECKEAGTDLAAYDPDPLFRFFSEIEARVGVLTNGIDYRFYADLGGEVTVDQRPFLEFNLLDCGPEDVGELERMRKSVFDIDEILSSARDLRYKRLFKDYLDLQWKSPDEKFVQFMAEQVSNGQLPDGVQERFGPVLRKAIQEFVRERNEAPSASTQQEEFQPTKQEDDPTSQEEDPTSVVEKEETGSTRQPEEPVLTKKNGEPSSTEHNGETPSREQVNGEHDGKDPFEKNLAARIIDDF